MRPMIAVKPHAGPTTDSEPDSEFAESAAEISVAMIEHLSAAIVHEVIQPISASVIDACAALRWLAGDPPDLKQARQALLRIVDSGNRASRVIELGRSLARKGPSRGHRLDINEAVREVVGLLRREAQSHDISLRTRLAGDMPPLQGDVVELQQVIVNLAVNAIEAMVGSKTGPRELWITTTSDGASDGLVTVRDTGPGIPSICFNRVFEPFYTTKAGGLGMGLSICRSIVDAHGGRLWAAHNEPRGAIFQFTLPSAIA
jgi:C4-dicarboxylate-specific signal transduction histidine kinase